jgi:hypothetical protein
MERQKLPKLTDEFFFERLEANVENPTTRSNYIAQLKGLLGKLEKLEKLEGGKHHKRVLHILTHPKKYGAMIEKLYEKLSTRKTMFALVLALYKHADVKCKYDAYYKKWKAQYDAHKDVLESKLKSNEPTKAQSEKYITFGQMQKALREMAEDDPHSTMEKSLRFCLVAMYAQVASKRSDFGSVRVHRRDPRKEYNYLVLPAKGDAYFVFHSHTKTDAKEELRWDITSDLQQVFLESIRRHPRKYLFVGQDGQAFRSSNAYSQFVIRTYTKVFGKRTGVTMHRHIFISEKIDFNKDSSNKLDYFTKWMGHSPAQQRDYRLIFDKEKNDPFKSKRAEHTKD